MKLCTVCHREYPAEPCFCPYDGCPLAETAPDQPVELVLTILTPPDEGTECAVSGSEVTLGQDPSCGIVLADPTASHRHAVLRADGSTWRVFDLGSRNGTFVNGERVGPDGRLLVAGDVLMLGHCHVFAGTGAGVPGHEARGRSVLAGEAPTYVEATLPGGRRIRALLRDTVLTIGREPDCGLPLPDPSVSHRHATMWLQGDWWHLLDSGSRNGTFVNEQPVGPRGYTLLDDDEIRVGSTRLHLGFGPIDEPPSLAVTCKLLVPSALAGGGPGAPTGDRAPNVSR